MPRSGADDIGVSSRGYVLDQGLHDTKAALERWRSNPWRVLRVWLAWSLLVAVGLLSAVWAVASIATPDLAQLNLPGLTDPANAGDAGRILARNLLVLALHAFACIAGFIAGSSLRHEADRREGFSKLIHEKAGPIAIGWVALVTTFSLTTQAYALGLQGATIAGALQISPIVLVLTALPQAIPELTALFLPLAAWLVASRRDEWSDLLAATLVTVLIALPTLIVAAGIELIVWPDLLRLASPVL